MRITFIVAVYPPEPEPAGVMARELATHWAAAGHEVRIICPVPNRPAGEVYPGYQRTLHRRSREGSLEVVRVRSWLIGKRRRSHDRVLENLSFGAASSLAFLAGPAPDVVIVEPWPILAQGTIAAAARLRGVPVLNYIQDIYPEAAISGGQVSEGSPTARVLATLDRAVLNAAARNIVVADSMKELLVARRGVPEERFVIIENWIDVDAMRPVPSPRWRSDVGLDPSDFVCMYAGTLGFASGADRLVEVAAALADEPRIRLVCIGEGVLKPQMEAELRRRGLRNLLLLPFQPRERVAEIQSSADLMLLTTAPGVGTTSIPSKLLTYLAVGRPVACAVSSDSDIARIVEGERVGVVVAPGDSRALEEAIRSLAHASRPDLDAMGHRARDTAVQRYSLRTALEKFDHVFREIGLPSA